MIIRRLEALFGFKIDTAQFNQATNAIDKFANNANTAMAALAGHFAVQTIKDFVDNTTQAMADVGRMAGMLGISTQALEELRYAAEKSGVAIDTLDDSMKELQIRAVDAKAGEGEAAEAFKKIGIKTTNAAGKVREPLELLSEVADKLKTLPNQSACGSRMRCLVTRAPRCSKSSKAAQVVLRVCARRREIWVIPWMTNQYKVPSDFVRASARLKLP